NPKPNRRHHRPVVKLQTPRSFLNITDSHFHSNGFIIHLQTSKTSTGLKFKPSPHMQCDKEPTTIKSKRGNLLPEDQTAKDKKQRLHVCELRGSLSLINR